MAELKKPVPWQDWPGAFTAGDLVELMPGFISRNRAYEIAKLIGKKYANAWIIQKEDFFNWFTGDDLYSTALKYQESKWTNEL